MAAPIYTTGKLEKHHNKVSFDCDIPQLNKYISEQAGQDMKRNMAITYVLTELDSDDVIGYYTLSSANIELKNLSEQEIKKLPRYPLLPATLIGRLAVDIKYQGKGIGELLLIHALKISLETSSKIAAAAVIVDAKNDRAAQFYQHFGFIRFPSAPSKLYLLIETVRKLYN